tara:strand:+ start:731 stop:943 length:213 start_codon:yes stop_codon:yes gene_type:complete
MPKEIINNEIREMSEEDVAAQKARSDISVPKMLAEQQAFRDREALRVSAKAKLVAGEKLTEEEANVLVGV